MPRTNGQHKHTHHTHRDRQDRTFRKLVSFGPKGLYLFAGQPAAAKTNQTKAETKQNQTRDQRPERVGKKTICQRLMPTKYLKAIAAGE